jgi:hypothetical protein
MRVPELLDRHPRATALPLSLEVAASSAALEGRQPGSFILRGALTRAPQDDEIEITDNRDITEDTP